MCPRVVAGVNDFVSIIRSFVAAVAYGCLRCCYFMCCATLVPLTRGMDL